jgi:long-chain acyl-CoA synthetase
VEQAMASKEVLSMINEKVLKVNSEAQSRVHQIKRWKILDREFTVDNGELTPTLKIKRRVIANMYQKQID